MQRNAHSGIREIFSCKIRNPRIWNPEYSTRNPESYYRLGFTNSLESSTWNPESKAWNPESKTVLDSLTCDDLTVWTYNCIVFPFSFRTKMGDFSRKVLGLISIKSPIFGIKRPNQNIWIKLAYTDGTPLTLLWCLCESNSFATWRPCNCSGILIKTDYGRVDKWHCCLC